MKRKAIVAFLWILIAAVMLGLGGACGKEKAEAPRTLKVVDSAGREVEVPYPLERVAVLSGTYGAETFLAMGAKDRMVAVSESAKKRAELRPLLENIPSAGKSREPNVEKLIELHPQAVIAYTCYKDVWLGIEEKLEAAGIKLLFLDFYKPKNYAREVRILGKLLGKEKRAEELINHMEKYMKLIRERVKDLKDEEKPRVFFESYPVYKRFRTVGPGHSDHDVITTCGGINVFAEEVKGCKTVSPEAVIEKDPDVIIATVYSGKLPAPCYKLTSTEPFEEVREMIMNTPGWSEIKAVREGRVYILSTDAKSVHPHVYHLYVAKWLHPKLFEDVNPEEVHKEWFEKFLGVEYRGIYAYPRPWRGEK